MKQMLQTLSTGQYSLEKESEEVTLASFAAVEAMHAGA